MGQIYSKIVCIETLLLFCMVLRVTVFQSNLGLILPNSSDLVLNNTLRKTVVALCVYYRVVCLLMMCYSVYGSESK